jgi:hypothetical protein
MLTSVGTLKLKRPPLFDGRAIVSAGRELVVKAPGPAGAMLRTGSGVLLFKLLNTTPDDDQRCLSRSDPELSPPLVPFTDLLPLRLARKDMPYTILRIENVRERERERAGRLRLPMTIYAAMYSKDVGCVSNCGTCSELLERIEMVLTLPRRQRSSPQC